MHSSFASNATLSKARAMYGKRLIESDYDNLLNCKTVSEVAAYLKQKTSYADILSGVNESNIHRERLEAIVRKKIFYDYAYLGRYEFSVGEHFSDYIVCKAEVEQIMHSLMLLEAGKKNEYIYSMPSFFNKHTEINLQTLANIKNYDEFLNALGNSGYKKILEPFKPNENEKIDLTKIETVLYSYLYKKVFYIIEKYTKGKAKSELMDIFNSYINLINFVRIIRLKKYYNADAQYIKSVLLPFETMPKNVLNQIIESEDADQAFNIMKNIRHGKKISNIEYNYIDEIPNKMNFLKCKHNIRFSVNPAVVMVSYIFLKEAELSNIINIIEGIRYNLTIEEIKRLLIY